MPINAAWRYYHTGWRERRLAATDCPENNQNIKNLIIFINHDHSGVGAALT
jgi:hypothetical protein